MTISIRRIAEVLLGPITVQRRLPIAAGGGRVVASARVGGLKYLFRQSDHLDPELLRIASLLVGDGAVTWDVGTNVGLFSVAAAAHSGSKGQVISVEADLDAVALLNRTAQLRAVGHGELTVLPVAVGSTNGFVRFSIAKRARASNAIQGYGSTQMGGISEIRVLPCITLDTLMEHFPAPNVLKIDVEGAEGDVLRGASKVLAEARPLIYCEVAEKSCEAVTALFRQFRYRMWDGASFDGRFVNELIRAANNTVAFPEEKVPN